MRQGKNEGAEPFGIHGNKVHRTESGAEMIPEFTRHETRRQP
jgi:hypothetical protein